MYRKIVSLKALHESDELNQEIQSMDSDFRQQKQKNKIFQRRGHKKKRMLNTDGLIFFVIISIPIDKRRPHSIVKQVEHLHHCNRKLQI